MNTDKYDFYSPTNIKAYNLQQTMKYQLDCLDRLDLFTKVHSENVANLTCRICEYLHLSKSFTIYCTICGYLHDIGKLYIPKEILHKPDKLTPEEYEIVKLHTVKGFEMCNSDLKLRPYADGVLNHHESLDGSGYPYGKTKKDIPLVAQIIRVADEYDAMVTKRHYTTHVNISEALKDLIQDTMPDNKILALDNLNSKYKDGKISRKILKTLFKVVIDDIYYEITCVTGYTTYLKEQIKRLKLINTYKAKMESATKEKTKNYYSSGINILLNHGETLENHLTLLQEYDIALNNRLERIAALHNEIKIIKAFKLK